MIRQANEWLVRLTQNEDFEETEYTQSYLFQELKNGVKTWWQPGRCYFFGAKSGTSSSATSLARGFQLHNRAWNLCAT